MKLRSPPLREDLEALWDFILTEAPQWLFNERVMKDIRGKVSSNNMGSYIENEFRKIRQGLGEHYRENPLNPPKEKKAKLGGDPDAFSAWLRKLLKQHMKSHVM